MKTETKLLIVEDDPKMQRLLVAQLGARGFDTRAVMDGAQAIGMASEFDPDAILLDLSLPGMSGLEVCRTVRISSDVPILLVTATDLPQTKIEALESGADDYLTKPFHMGELVARIGAILRRSGARSQKTAGAHEIGDLRVDLVRREVSRKGEAVALTKTEFDLLSELVTNPDRVLTYGHLLEHVWGPGNFDVRPVHVHMCNLRRKISDGPMGPRLIQAVPGVGYRLVTGE